MKKKQIYLFIISICLSTNMLIGQTESNSNDTLIKKDKLLKINKIRLGFDLLKPVLSSSEGDNLNYEIVGDLQLTENIYLAGEYGLVDKVIEDENINFNSTGSFLRIGFLKIGRYSHEICIYLVWAAVGIADHGLAVPQV